MISNEERREVLFKEGQAMSDGCIEEGRMSCTGCPKYWSCEKTAESRKILPEIKGFYQDHPGKRYRQSYGKNKRKSAARAKVKR